VWNRDRFEELVADAIDAMPEWVRRSLDNVEILIDDEPPEGEDAETLGLYVGIPLTSRGSDYSGVQPDTITLFAGPIGREARASGEAVPDVVARTLRHEIAHHFGIDDDRLLEIDRY
jgi:predicted Zn-dependent protease with MMP-like domain